MVQQLKTYKTLLIVSIDTDEYLLLVRGAVAGPAGSYILIRKAKSAK
jgi:ribosomal protein L3